LTGSATVAAGGWPAEFANLIGEIRGVESAPIEFELADDLAFWRAEIPGKVSVWAEALTGPTTPEGHGFSWNRSGKSSKHIPFDWSGPS
jgi:hypothetical protein